MTLQDFKPIYDEILKNGYYFSGQRVFMRSFDFTEECKKHVLEPIKTFKIGNFYNNENADVYMIYDTEKFELEEARMIMDKKFG